MTTRAGERHPAVRITLGVATLPDEIRRREGTVEDVVSNLGDVRKALSRTPFA